MNSMIFPPNLKANDLVLIVAPAKRVKKDDLKLALEYLKQWNLTYEFGQNTFNEYENGYWYSGTPQQRLADLQWAMNHSTAKAIWCAAGGYGCVHLIERLSLTEFYNNPKWLIGYSDICVLHSFLQSQQIASILSNTAKPLNLNYLSTTYTSLHKALFGNHMQYQIAPHHLNQFGQTKAVLLGGNLSILYSLLATEYRLKHKEYILLIEDWYENWYHLDRMLQTFKMAGLFGNLAGILVGSFTKMDLEEENPEFDASFDSKSYQIIHSFVKDLAIPVGFAFPSGHTGDNRALILGKTIDLVVNENGCFVS